MALTRASLLSFLSGRLVEFLTLDGDPVLGTLKLGLEFQEVLVGLQVRISLNRHKQAAYSGTQLVLGTHEAGELILGESGGVDGSLSGFGPGLHHRLESR